MPKELLQLDLDECYQEIIKDIFVRGSFTWESDIPIEFQNYFLTRTRNDGIQLLIYEKIANSSEWKNRPLGLIEALSAAAKNDAIIDGLRQQDFVQLAQTLSEKGIEPILLKGAALSLSHYPASYLRTRSDTDFFIPENSIENLRRIASDQGYRFEEFMGGKFTQYQQSFSGKDALGVNHIYDAHWRLCNPQLFAGVLSYEEVLEQAVSVEIFGLKIKIISPEHALLHACIHRIAHHYDEQKLIWLYDIHLLLNRQNDEARDAFYKLAHHKEMRAVCYQGFIHAQNWFQTPIPEGWLALFKTGVTEEKSAKFITLKPRIWDVFFNNFSALGGWQKRLRFVWEQFFPSRGFMIQKYSIKNTVFLPWFYCYRLVAGFPKLFQKLKS